MSIVTTAIRQAIVGGVTADSEQFPVLRAEQMSQRRNTVADSPKPSEYPTPEQIETCFKAWQNGKLLNWVKEQRKDNSPRSTTVEKPGEHSR